MFLCELAIVCVRVGVSNDSCLEIAKSHLPEERERGELDDEAVNLADDCHLLRM